MKRLALFLAIMVSLAGANSSDFATKDDVRAIRDDIKLLIHQVDKRFEQVDKRFEQVDKRFDMMQHNMNKRFEQIDRRLDMMENRFNLIMGLIVGGFIFFYRYLLVEHRKLKDHIIDELRSQLEKRQIKVG